MFRMNFLVIMLCFVMNRPYQFYYFVPLVSFFFLGIYATMALWPHVTEDSTRGKICCVIYYIEENSTQKKSLSLLCIMNE